MYVNCIAQSTKYVLVYKSVCAMEISESDILCHILNANSGK